MVKRFLMLAAILVLGSQVVLAQAVRVGRGKTAPPEKARVRSAVTVIDLRNIAGEKKPPKREADAIYSMRMTSGSKTAKARTGLAPMQLSEALKGAGLNITPPNVYARFAPNQINVPGKGYMLMVYPAWVYPDHIDFQSSYYGDGRNSANGAMVVLKEPGTYVLDFLVEFPGVPAGTVYDCEVLRGGSAFQIQAVYSEGGPQHILIVTNQDALYQGLDDWNKSIGLHCMRSNMGEMSVAWTLYLVDVTKL